MNATARRYLYAAGSILDIAPSTDYSEFADNSSDYQSIMSDFQRIGCDFERSISMVISLNAPDTEAAK